MYKSPDYDYVQLSILSFNESCGLQLDPDNELVRIAFRLSRRSCESMYAALFPSETGNVAKPCRMVLGYLILQARMGFTDRDLINQIR